MSADARRTIEAAWPAGLTEQQVIAWVHLDAVSGTIRERRDETDAMRVHLMRVMALDALADAPANAMSRAILAAGLPSVGDDQREAFLEGRLEAQTLAALSLDADEALV